jgi:hypothetical protein
MVTRSCISPRCDAGHLTCNPPVQQIHQDDKTISIFLHKYKVTEMQQSSSDELKEVMHQ